MRTLQQMFIVMGLLLSLSFAVQAEEGEPIGEGGIFTLIKPDDIKMTLDDIVGIGEIKDDVIEIIDIISDPEKYQKIGGSTVKGLLLYGPPGTGKTMLSKAIAKEAKIPFISVDPTAFQGQYVQDAQKTAKMLYRVARQLKPCIIFIDEIESVLPSRAGKLSESQQAMIAQFLIEMDGINAEKNEGITLLGTTNQINQIDSAFLRPGRLDTKIYVRLPNTAERLQILELYVKKIPTKGKLDMAKVAQGTPGFSGADLKSIIVRASNHAAYNNQKHVTMADIEFAMKKVIEELKERRTAYKTGEDALDFEMIHADDIDITFDDIAGYKEVKNEVAQIIDFMRNPEKYEKLGAVSPKGIMLHGPPGTGKTMLARAIAAEGDATFIAVSGADFNQRYVGVGAQRVRELFEVARQFPPAIVFIDEIDAVASKRSSSSSNQSDMQTVNQLLTELDNISGDRNSSVIVIGATNLLDNLDPAVIRAGRIDRKVKVKLPNKMERKEILKIYLKNVPHSKKLDLDAIVNMTSWFSGAQIKNLVNEAAINAATNNKKEVTQEDFDFARGKIQYGLETESVMTEEQHRKTAYHEIGHALVGMLIPEWPYPFYDLEIANRDMSLGLVAHNFEGDEGNWSYAKFRAKIAIGFGGRAAEEIIYGKENVEGGISSDMENATKIAAHLVNDLAMSPSYVAYSAIDAQKSKEANEEIQRILEEEYNRAKKLLTENKHILEMLTNQVMKTKRLSYEEAKKVVDKHKASPSE